MTVAWGRFVGDQRETVTMMLDVAGGVLIAAFICAVFALGIKGVNEKGWAGLGMACIIVSILAGAGIVLI